MGELLGETQSLCPICLRRIPARRIAESRNVYMEKTCPEHGDYKVLIWRNHGEHYREWSRFGGKTAKGPQKRLTDVHSGCPYDCGLCPEHKQDTCMVVMEVTGRCNLRCPICFAGANERHTPEPDLDVIRGMYETLLDSVGPYPVQLSGGEPTLRDNLPQIVALGKDMGFDHIQVNTNGLRIAEDIDYLHKLKDNGATLVYLQFDGVTDDVNRYLRGKGLLAFKVKAIENCSKVKIGVILVPTLIPRINDQQIGDIIRFAKRWIPIVKGVHFQPIGYFGRYPRLPNNEDRITIPEVIKAIQDQTQGEIKAENFVPPGCEHPHCSFSGFFVLMEDGKLLPTTRFLLTEKTVHPNPEDAAEQARQFIQRRWRLTEEDIEKPRASCECKPGSWLEFYERARRDYLCVSGMAFQDAWNIDLERLKRCCIHIIVPPGRVVPLCAYYVTSIDGRRLYGDPSLVYKDMG